MSVLGITFYLPFSDMGRRIYLSITPLMIKIKYRIFTIVSENENEFSSYAHFFFRIFEKGCNSGDPMDALHVVRSNLNMFCR